MKLQWWLTSLRSIYASPSTPPPAQPIVLLLHFLIHRHSFTQRLFTRILNARLSDLTPSPPHTVDVDHRVCIQQAAVLLLA